MKIEKRPSGSYRVRQMVNGKSYSISFDHYPTKKEIALEFSQIMNDSPKGSFSFYAKKYMKEKDNLLSPTTANGYESIQNVISKEFANKQIGRITKSDVQKEVNRYAIGHAPKTVKNFHGFITAVLNYYDNKCDKSVLLPQEDEPSNYIPLADDVTKVLKVIEGEWIECAVLLACYGLRRSEICAITKDDLDGNELTINKELVKKKKEWVIKHTKTQKSIRKIFVSDRIVELLNENEAAYNGHPDSLTRAFHRYQRAAGVPEFRLHDMRHFFATKMSAILPEADVLKLGGWSTPHVMKRVYRHSEIDRDEKQRKNASVYLQNILS